MDARDIDNGKLDDKETATFEVVASPDGAPAFDSTFGDTIYDVSDMRRLGKKQEFKRNFGLLSSIGFNSIYQASWEIVILVLALYLYNGGLAGLFWTFTVTVPLYSSVVASLAEMESMAPTSGGQYHWVSEFAPASCQKFLSYSAGWTLSLAWLAAMASGPFLVTTLVEVLIQVTQPEFSFPAWQYTLIMLAFLVITIGFNTWGARVLPMLEIVSLFGHIAGFIVVIVALLVMTPKNSAEDVFTTFVNEGGWSNIGTACLVNQLSVLYTILGSDTVVHISEEVEDASEVVPRTMWWSYILNAVIAYIMLIVMLFCVGNLDDAINSPIPYLKLFKNTGSDAMAITLLIILVILIYSGNITSLATTSRETWAFSRDRGFPFSKWISRIDRKYQIPTNSVYLTSVLAGILCLINLGSSLAFNIIVSLSLLAILSTYTLSIGCVLLKRIRGQPLPPARWSLGRWGLPINAIGFIYSCFAFVFCCFPAALPVDLSTANWGPALWAAVALIALLIYVFWGRKHYTPPVIFVEGVRDSGMGFQST